MNVPTCGWPTSKAAGDGPCGQPATTLYLVDVYAVPIGEHLDETQQAVLAVCDKHNPITPSDTVRFSR